MVSGYSLDPNPQANYAKEQFAIIYAPRLKRDRIPAKNVEIIADLDQARAAANPKKHRFAAKVVGPARSSEGFEMFYILEIFK